MGSHSLRRIVLSLGLLAGVANGSPTYRRPPDADATLIAATETRNIINNGPTEVQHRPLGLLKSPLFHIGPKIGVPTNDASDDTTTDINTTDEEPKSQPSTDQPDGEASVQPHMIRPTKYRGPLLIPELNMPSVDHKAKESGEYLFRGRPVTFNNKADRTADDSSQLDKRWTSPEGRYINEWSTIITLINATPYRWRRGYSHSYQMEKWDERFPEYIEPGQSHRIFNARMGGLHLLDSAGEVAYHLEGTSKPMSFMVERRKGVKHPIFIRFLENLETKTLGKKSQIDLGFHMFPGGSTFILAGTERNFVCTGPPKGWMQDMLPEIGHMPLRSIIMPRSHHVGMSKGNTQIGLGQAANTLCQTKTAKHQIEELGVRVLDVRPFLFQGTYRAAHGTMILGAWNGMLGESVKDIGEAVRTFHNTYPGELIIIDIPAPDTGYIFNGRQEMTEEHIQGLYKILISLTKPLVLPDDEDITQWPLERFIGNKTSGTIIRVSQSWAERKSFPGGQHGFVSDKNFPMNHRWSNTNTGEAMFRDQIDYIRRNRAGRDSKLFHADWVITQSIEDAVFPTRSINKMALEAYGGLYNDLWNATTDQVYPNWIATDNIHSSELTSFVVALNHCFVARKCGSLGGKVKKFIKGKTGKKFIA